MESEKPLSAGTALRSISLPTKLILGFALLSAFVSFLTARGIYTNQQPQVENEFVERASGIVNLASQQQDGDEFAQITSADDPLYEQFRQQNLRVQKSDGIILRVYTLRQDAQGIYFVTDTGDPATGNVFAYGTKYSDPPAELIDSFNEPQDAAVSTQVQTTPNAQFRPAYAPIMDGEGNQVGVLGMDISIQDTVARQRQIVRQSVIVFFFALGIGSFFGWAAGRALTEPIAKLTQGAQAFAAGKFDQPIEITTRDEIENLANAFNSMAGDLRNLITGLEDRVAERTQDLESRSQELETANARIRRRAAQFEALAQVTQSITSVRDLQQLLPRVAVVISDNFNFYHIGIFQLDSFGEYAVLVAANSAGGQKMLARKHRLRVGEEGIVGYAAFTAKPRIALDVGKDAVFFNNPDLPETHSEVALPLISNNIIVGVLDVQSTEVAAFSDEDIQMLSLLADQVSLAIENARLFEGTRRALAEAEMASRRATREAWKQLSEQQKLLGFRYDITGASPLKKPVRLTGSESEAGTADPGVAGQTVVPIALRGETIGSLIVQSSSGEQWDRDQLDLIRAVAERIALSAENARLFEETTARADRERLVSEITGKIRSHNDPQAMIQTAMEELRTALGASRVEVLPNTVKGAEKSEA